LPAKVSLPGRGAPARLIDAAFGMRLGFGNAMGHFYRFNPHLAAWLAHHFQF
jgi:hypothetical protein